jgi:hypothetical protein
MFYLNNQAIFLDFKSLLLLLMIFLSINNYTYFFIIKLLIYWIQLLIGIFKYINHHMHLNKVTQQKTPLWHQKWITYLAFTHSFIYPTYEKQPLQLHHFLIKCSKSNQTSYKNDWTCLMEEVSSWCQQVVNWCSHI